MKISYFPSQSKIEVKQKNVEKKALRYWSLESDPSEILTYTHAPTAVQQESRLTDAFEAAVFVDAQSVKAHVPDQAFVLVWGFKGTLVRWWNAV